MLLRGLIAGVLWTALCVFLVLWLSAAPTVESVALDLSQAQIPVGTGSAEPDRVRIESLDPEGNALVLWAPIYLPTEQVPTLRLRLQNMPRTMQATLFWWYDGQVFERELVTGSNGELWVRMNDVPQWSGELDQIAIGFHVITFATSPITLTRPIEITEVETAGGLWAGVRALWWRWTSFQHWRMRSMDFAGAAPEGRSWLQPVPAVAIWSLGLIALCLWSLRGRSRRFACVGVFLAGWIACDALWRVELFRQNLATREIVARAGTTSVDPWLEQTGDSIQALLPADERIFVWAPSAYAKLRVVYHLLPIKAGQLDTPERLRRGDLLLVYQGEKAAKGRLSIAGHELGVRLLHVDPDTSLYRITQAVEDSG